MVSAQSPQVSFKLGSNQGPREGQPPPQPLQHPQLRTMNRLEEIDGQDQIYPSPPQKGKKGKR